MKNITVIVCGALMLFSVQLMAENSVRDIEMGLSQTSVFETPEPKAFSYREKFPGSGEILPRAYPDAPPQIPHNIASFKPITAKVNMCMGCHNNPSMIGKKVKGQATPIPASHYTDIRHKPGVQGGNVIGARYVCTQCHVPQATVEPLVENIFVNPDSGSEQSK